MQRFAATSAIRYRQLEALPDIGAHQLLIHLLHVTSQTLERFCLCHLCLTGRLFLVSIVNSFIIIVVVVIIIII